MDQWDILVPSRDGKQWGFFKPKDELIHILIKGFVQHTKKPDDFYPEDDKFAD